MIKTLLTILAIYLIYQVVRGLFTANVVIKKFNDAANSHNEQQRQQQQRNYNAQPKPTKTPTDSIGDYVDYEEIDDK